MDTPTGHWVEVLTGLAAAGCQVAVGYSHGSKQGHPLVPLLSVTDVNDADPASARHFAGVPLPPPANVRDCTPLTRETLCVCVPVTDADVKLHRSSADSVTNDAVLGSWVHDVTSALQGLLNGSRAAQCMVNGNTDFQISRGRIGVSV